MLLQFRILKRVLLYLLRVQIGVLLFSLWASLPADAQKLGDLNGEGSVTICDLAILHQHLLSNPSNGFSRLTTNNLALPLADMDTNGVITFVDFQLLLDTIVGRLPVKDFDLSLLSYDDGDGFSYLEDWYYGTNPFLRDTDGDGIEDEIDVNSPGAVYVAQPPVDVLRASADGGLGVFVAQPPVQVLRLADEQGLRGIVLAQPPLEILRLSADGGLGIVVAEPPVDVLRASADGGLGVIMAQPPVEVLRASADGGLGVVVAQPPVKVVRP